MTKNGVGRTIWMIGCGFAFLAVAAGAFGAHILRDRLPEDLMSIFETAVRYQMYHALALLVVAWAAESWRGRLPQVAGGLFVIGILLFSGSLFVLVATGMRWLGAVTPLGGVAFLAGWVALGLAGWRRKSTDPTVWHKAL